MTKIIRSTSKSCARCKSKYWNKKPQRKIKYRYGGPVAGARAYFRTQNRLKQSKQNNVGSRKNLL